jgi:hypothetical protein
LGPEVGCEAALVEAPKYRRHEVDEDWS